MGVGSAGHNSDGRVRGVGLNDICSLRGEFLVDGGALWPMVRGEAGSVVKDKVWAIGVVNGAGEGTHGGLSMPG